MKTIKLIKSEIHHLKNLLQMDAANAPEDDDSFNKMRIRMAKKIIEKL